MKPDDFEKQLQRQPLRAVPAEWRTEILKAAKSHAGAGARRLRSGDEERCKDQRVVTPASTVWWREWLWPAPQAWAGLAALWVVIAILRLPVSHPADIVKQMSQPSPETESTLAAQRRELARLLDNFNETIPAPRPAPPGPRSENLSPPKV